MNSKPGCLDCKPLRIRPSIQFFILEVPNLEDDLLKSVCAWFLPFVHLKFGRNDRTRQQSSTMNFSTPLLMLLALGPILLRPLLIP